MRVREICLADSLPHRHLIRKPAFKDGVKLLDLGAYCYHYCRISESKEFLFRKMQYYFKEDSQMACEIVEDFHSGIVIYLEKTNLEN